MLVNCCLVQVSVNADHDRTLSMHKQLHDLAHNIVREEGSSVSQRTRLLGTDSEVALKDEVQAQVSEVVYRLLACLRDACEEALKHVGLERDCTLF